MPCPNKTKYPKGECAYRLPILPSEVSIEYDECKKYMLIPFVSVAIAVSSSLQLLQGKTIDVKFIYILGVSFVSAALMEWLCVKAGILRYEKSEEIG